MTLLFIGGDVDGQRLEVGEQEQFAMVPGTLPANEPGGQSRAGQLLYRRVKIEIRTDSIADDPMAWKSIAWDVMLLQELPDEAAVESLIARYAAFEASDSIIAA